MRVRASITLFMCMIIMMVTSLGFTLMEVSRFYGVDKKATLITATAADNSFSEYIEPLWEQYGILGVDMAHGTSDEGDTFLKERILEFADMQCQGNVDYFGIEPSEVQLDDYMLLTDNDGEAFVHEAAVYYRDNIANELIKSISDISNDLNNLENVSGAVDQCITEGGKSLKEIDKNKLQSTSGSTDSPSSEVSVETNASNLSREQISKGETMMDDVSGYKSRGILEQVIPDNVEVSEASFDMSNSVSKRNLRQGNSINATKATAIDKVVFSVYLKDKFQHFGKELGHSGQQYELEYIVAGKDNDTDNLKSVVGRLIAIREAANFAAIMTSPAKKAEAMELATAVAGASCNPAVIEVVQYGLIASWAYMESVLDLRLLLDGGKVAPIKSEAEWTSNLYNLATCMDVNYKAKNCELGMDYESYLMSLMVFQSTREESMRALDMIENSMNTLPYYENLKMDHLICDMNISINYEADPMFYSLVTLDVPFLDFYRLCKQEYRSFL